MLGALGAPFLCAADPASKPTAPIEIARCRIKLIDQVTLASDRSGIISYVEAEEGHEVQEGQKIAGLQDEVAAANLAVAQKKSENDVEIRFSKKAAELAQAEYEKALDANQIVKNAVPDIEVRRLKLAAEKSALQIEQADHQRKLDALNRDQAQAELNTYRVKVPFDGVVTRVFKHKGEAVRQGDPILELASTRRVRVEGDLDIQHLTQVQPGCRVVVQLDIPDVELEIEKETFEGRVEFVDVNVQPVSRQVRIWARVQNRGEILRAGLTARMMITPDASGSAAADVDRRPPANRKGASDPFGGKK
ncbi:MAG: efflux RND transporter periplasmic adaptor subunit [Planctomycetaceae bacterium]|nr:efflux RND transporter periplasmic adaptor subunit [Planctomycetaceae bacterium]